MFHINKDSSFYDPICNIIAGVAGFGASVIVGALCNNVISTSSSSNSIMKTAKSLGKVGLESLAIYEVTAQFRDDLDDAVDMFNDAVNEWERYRSYKCSDTN